MNCVKLRFFAKKRVKHYFFIFEKTTLSSYDESNFKDFKLEHSNLVWSNELDLASEYLFYVAFKDDPDLQDQFKEWGYLAS